MRAQILNKKKLLKGKNIFIQKMFQTRFRRNVKNSCHRCMKARRNNMIDFLRYDQLKTGPRMPMVGNNDEMLENLVIDENCIMCTCVGY